MKKIILPVIFFVFLLAVPAYAHCPLCTAAVGVAAASANYYGLDLTIIGLLVGAFAISTGLWIGLKFSRKYSFILPLVISISFFLTVIPLYYTLNSDEIYLPLLLAGSTGSFLNKVYWIDKFLFGSFLGSLIIISSYLIHLKIKKINGRVLFPFQGLVITLILITLSGLGIYFMV